MSDLEETASNDPNSPERERSRSPRHPSPPPPLPPPPPQAIQAAVNLVGELARRTCPVCFRHFDSIKAMWGHSWVHRERRDQIYAMGPPGPGPIPPPPPALGSNGLAVGRGGGGSFMGWHPWKIDSRDERDRTCPRCSKVFASPKAMFGHLHVHYEKGEKGFNSKPPKLGPSALPPRPSAAAPTLLALPPPPPPAAVEENGNGDGEEENSIDLNRMPAETEEEEEEDAADGEDSMLFDLNMTPPSD